MSDIIEHNTYEEAVAIVEESEKSASVGRRENTDGTCILDIIHDDYTGAVEVLRPTIQRSIRMGAETGRMAKKIAKDMGEPVEEISLMSVFPSGYDGAEDMLAMYSNLKVYCKPMENEAFTPEEWASEELLVSVFKEVKKFHANFR